MIERSIAGDDVIFEDRRAFDPFDDLSIVPTCLPRFALIADALITRSLYAYMRESVRLWLCST